MRIEIRVHRAGARQRSHEQPGDDDEQVLLLGLDRKLARFDQGTAPELRESVGAPPLAPRSLGL
jgi:hypothetical protein